MRSLFALTFVSLLSIGTSIAAAQPSCDEQYVVSRVNLVT
jgi:hypothetical protein